jgi:hypothetical protein
MLEPMRRRDRMFDRRKRGQRSASIIPWQPGG